MSIREGLLRLIQQSFFSSYGDENGAATSLCDVICGAIQQNNYNKWFGKSNAMKAATAMPCGYALGMLASYQVSISQAFLQGCSFIGVKVSTAKNITSLTPLRRGFSFV